MPDPSQHSPGWQTVHVAAHQWTKLAPGKSGPARWQVDQSVQLIEGPRGMYAALGYATFQAPPHIAMGGA